MKNSYNELVSLIEEKRNEEFSYIEEESDNKKIEYLNDFFNRYSIKRPGTWSNLKPSEILFAFILEENPNFNFDDLRQDFEDAKNNVDLLDDLLLNQIGATLQNGRGEIIDQLLELEKEIESPKNMSHTFIKKKKAKDILKKIFGIPSIISAFDKDTILDVIKIIKVLERIHDPEHLNFICFISKLQKEINMIKTKTHGHISEDIIEEIVQMNLKSTINTKQTEEVLAPTFNYYLNLEKKQHSILKEKNKRMAQYTKLLGILKIEHQKDEITNLERILDQITDSDILLASLKYINEHNQRYYKKLEQEYKMKKENSILEYISFFRELEIDFSSLNQEFKKQLLRKSIHDIKQEYKYLKEIGFSKEVLINILCNSELDIIKKLYELFQNGYLDIKLLYENPGLYYEISHIENINKNIKTLKQVNINIISKEDKTFLLTEHNLLEHNIKILSEYGMLPQKADITHLEMLTKPNLQKEIDGLIEVGLEDIIKENPDILNSDGNLMKRIIITRIVGEEIIDNKKIKSFILEKDSFFVPNKMIDNYLLDRNNTEYHSNNTIEFGEDVVETDLSYCIEGVYIPKSRVKNLRVSLENIIRPSLYSQEEIKKLEQYEKKKRIVN